MPGHAYNSILDLVMGCPDLIAGRFGDMTAGLGSTAIQPLQHASCIGHQLAAALLGQRDKPARISPA
jgi:hypothetical protein